jgi:hypothetical protein
MANNPTKILMYDIDPELGKLVDSLKLFQGTYASINDRLMDLTADTFSSDITTLIDDLIAGHQDGGVLTIQRIENLKTDLENKDTDLAEAIATLEGKLLTVSFDSGTFNEHFTYDATYGNVTKHEITGDKITTINYNYADLAAGKLSTSVQTFINSDSKTVTITKTYTYDANENITDIGTVTTVAP